MRHRSLRVLCILAAPALAVALSACGQSQDPTAVIPASVAQTSQQVDAAAQAATVAAQAADEAKAAELSAKEQELADRESALKQQELEAELAKRDAETATARAAAARQTAANQQAAAKRASVAKPAATTASAADLAPKALPVMPILVPAGTQLAIELITPVSTKTNNVGDGVDARLASDLVIGDRRAASAGASVHGTITQIISGSDKVGGTPTLGITFDSLVANGSTVSINAPFTQVGKSETGKDTAKIVGGAAAGAIIGHQVSDKNGSVVGGLLGAAAGTAAAKKTGGEVTLAGGQVVSAAILSSFEARP